MSCDNLLVPNVALTNCPTNLFGIPYGVAGRTVGGTVYPIAGIVLHCYPGTAAELCNEMKCRTKQSVISGTAEQSYHYGIGANIGVYQHVNDNDISWSFGSYKANSYITAPPPNVAVNWPTLQALYGVNVTPDVYTIDIALAIGHIVDATQSGCFTCPTASGLQQPQHDILVQLLAYLVQEYSLPIDSEHITFHDLIRCDEGQECACTDIETLLGEVAAFCPPCEGDEAPTAPEAQPDDEINYVMGITEACCPDSAGCYVKIPWNACFVGDLAVDGDLESYILGLTQDPVTGQWCLTRGCIATVSPIVGCGTVDDPIMLDRCLFGDWLPDMTAQDVVNLVAIDDQGCLIEAPAADVVQELETPITPVNTDCIMLTVSGQSDHTLQADIVISACQDNLITCEADGLCVQSQITCENVASLFDPGTIQNVYGDNGIGDCITQPFEQLLINKLCEYPTSTEPVELLLGKAEDGEGGTECPVYVTPDNVVAAGLVVSDTECIDLTLVDNVLSANIIISNQQGNLIECDEGLLLTDFVVNDTACINLSYGDRELQADPIVSPSINGITNVFSCEPTGMYVPRGADALVNGPLTGNGSDTNPLDLDLSLMDAQDLCDFGDAITPGSLVDLIGRDLAGCLRYEAIGDVINDALTTQDGNCVSVSLAAGVLSAEAIIDPALDNQVTCGANGLYVPPGQTLSVLDTDCVNLNFVGDVLSATITLAGTQAGIPNVAACLPGQGFYVPQGAGLVTLDTNCIDLTLLNGVLSANPILDPNVDNQLVCNANGLFVPSAAGVAVDDTDCIELDLTAGVITADVVVAPAQGGNANALSCIPGQGLFVSATGSTNLVVDDTDCINLTLIGNTLTADPIISPLVDNLLECTVNGLYAALNIDAPIVGDGTAGNPLDIDFTLLDAQDLCDIGEVIEATGPASVGTDGFVILDPATDCLTHGDRLHNTAATAPPTGVDCAAGYTVGSKWTIPPFAVDPLQDRQVTWIMVEDCRWVKIWGGTWASYGNSGIPEVVPANTIFVPDVNSVGFDVLGEVDIVADQVVSLGGGKYQTHAAIQIDITAIPPLGADLIIEVIPIVDGFTTGFAPIIQRITNPQTGVSYNLTGVTQAYSANPGSTIQIGVRHNAGGNANLTSLVLNTYEFKN